MQRTQRSTQSCKNVAKFDVPKMPPRAASNRYGKCHFPYREEMEAPYLTPPENDPAPIAFPHWTFLLEDKNGRDYDVLSDRTLHLSSEVLCRNVMTIGKIGSGKTQKVIWPTVASALANKDQSIVLLATKGDEYDLIKKICAKFRPGGRVERINLSSSARTTMGWNPFACSGKPDRLSEARQNGQILSEINGIGDHDSPFFRQNAARLMAGIILALEKKHGVATPSGLYHVLESSEADRKKFFDAATRRGVPFLKEFRDADSGYNSNLQTVLVEARGDCQHLVDSNMALVTSYNEFQFDLLFDEPTVVVFEAFQDDIMKTRPFINMFFAQLFDAVSRRAKSSPRCKLPRPLTIVLDDFAASVGRIPGCAQRFNTMRSMDARLVVALQSLAQLDQYYNPGETLAIISAFGTKIFHAGLNVSDAQYASAESGETTVGRAYADELEAKKSGESPRDADFFEYGRPLLLGSDVRFSPKHPEYGAAATVFLPDALPFQAWLPSAWQLPELQDVMKYDVQKSSDVDADAANAAEANSERETDKRDDSPKSLREIGEEADSCRDRLLRAARPQTNREFRQAIKENKVLIRFDQASAPAKEWWETWIRENRTEIYRIWRFTAELATRKATLNEYYLAMQLSKTDDVEANLLFMAYRRVVKAKEEEMKTADRQEQERLAWLSDKPPIPSVSPFAEPDRKQTPTRRRAAANKKKE
ncbi:MAG: type IV secretory system conjugative DNA transfer family protein [Thermoguttaceae bacterium]|nr:type IV secretory system conjugative DNA transfer family protein [Thermoguttaceae bacterium]